MQNIYISSLIFAFLTSISVATTAAPSIKPEAPAPLSTQTRQAEQSARERTADDEHNGRDGQHAEDDEQGFEHLLREAEGAGRRVRRVRGQVEPGHGHRHAQQELAKDGRRDGVEAGAGFHAIGARLCRTASAAPLRG
mgnify:CR=1 FL=1